MTQAEEESLKEYHRLYLDRALNLRLYHYNVWVLARASREFHLRYPHAHSSNHREACDALLELHSQVSSPFRQEETIPAESESVLALQGPVLKAWGSDDSVKESYQRDRRGHESLASFRLAYRRALESMEELLEQLLRMQKSENPLTLAVINHFREFCALSPGDLRGVAMPFMSDEASVDLLRFSYTRDQVELGAPEAVDSYMNQLADFRATRAYSSAAFHFLKEDTEELLSAEDRLHSLVLLRELG